MTAPRRVVLAAALAGAGLALLVTLLLPETYRASGVLVLTREGRAPGDDPTLGPAAESAAELLASRAVAEAAVANLRLDDSADELLDRVDVDVGARSSLLTLAVEAREPEEARRTAQELAEVFTVLYNTRFGPETTASIWEAPRAEEDAVAPEPARNVALGALVGALAGLALVWRRRRPQPRPSAAPEPAPDPAVERRVAAVTQRELALARRAAELALRERELAAPPPAAPPPPPAEPIAEPEPEPIAEPEPEPEPEPFAVPAVNEWTVRDVERLLALHGHAFPERRDELGFYLESFRDVADAEGRLPAGVEAVVEDVFADLIGRARRE